MQASWQLGATINNLYANYPQADNKGFTDGIGKVINKILKDIYDGVSNAFINKDLFNFTKNELDKAIDEGTIELKDNVPNKAYIKELKTNASVFSAFKNHQQTKAIHALLLDDNGDLVTFSKFKKGSTKNIEYLQYKAFAN